MLLEYHSTRQPTVGFAAIDFSMLIENYRFQNKTKQKNKPWKLLNMQTSLFNHPFTPLLLAKFFFFKGATTIIEVGNSPH